MKKGIVKILASMLLASSMVMSFTGCFNNNNNKTTTQESSRDRVSRKPQVSVDNTNSTESLYQDGEIISLADGSKLKYNKDGNHELLQKGSGKIIIFKKVTQAELNELTGEQRAIVERQMQSDPNGFSVIY